jgi:hypothetical protein
VVEQTLEFEGETLTVGSFLEDVYAEVADTQVRKQEELMQHPNVVGCGVGHKITGGVDTQEPCLTVFVTHKLDPDQLAKGDVIPARIGDIKTDVYATGEIFAAPAAQDVEAEALKVRTRPVEGGYSVGHVAITAGTYATAVIDRVPNPGIPPRYYVLSNNHVLANSNDAKIGDPILQPGPADGGHAPADVIARLSRFVPIRFDGSDNYVDAAIAAGPFDVLDREIYWIGYVNGWATVQVKDIVRKTGRTTNYTTGQVIGVNATVNVNYGGGKVAKMTRQILTTPMSAPGDSGSLVCNYQNLAVGLLFAGSSRITVCNDIRYVLAMLNIRFA